MGINHVHLMKMIYFYHRRADIRVSRRDKRQCTKRRNLRQEVENLSRIFFDTFATATDNIFEIVHAQFCKLMLQMDEKDQHNRSLREVSGWCNAFILYLSTELHD